MPNHSKKCLFLIKSNWQNLSSEFIKKNENHAYLAQKPKCDRPIELRSDVKMLTAWLRLRNNKTFRDDVMCRHGLHVCYAIDEQDPAHEHAIANAWSHCVQILVIMG